MKAEILSAAVLEAFPDYDGHEKVVHFTDQQTGLNAFIAVHNSNCGPGLGGCRMVPYASEAEAITDVLRLSRGMTYKNALAGLALGGGKAVIIGNARTQKTEALIRAMGRAVESLDGLYVTAEDSGTGEADMAIFDQETKHVVGLPGRGPDDVGGDPSPVTAYGVYHGLRAAAAWQYGSANLSGKIVAVQGLGAVGYDLCRYLHKDGVRLIVTDIHNDVLDRARNEFSGIEVVSPGAIFDAEADIFAPCALGAQLNDATIPRLKVSVVAGAANNQLATPKHQDMLAARGILYAPDYAVNAGGVITVGYEHYERAGINPTGKPLNRANMMAHVETIGPTVTKILDDAKARGIGPAVAADQLAESIFMQGRARCAVS